MRKNKVLFIVGVIFLGITGFNCTEDPPELYSIVPVIEVPNGLSFDEIESVTATITASGKNLPDVYDLHFDAENGIDDTIVLPEGVSECSLSVVIYGNENRKLGLGGYSVNPDDYTGRMCVTEAILIESAKPYVEKISADPDVVGINDDFSLEWKAFDGFDGHIASYKLKIGDGDWEDVDSEGMELTAPSQAVALACSLEVKDDEGNTGYGAVVVNVELRPPVADAGADRVVLPGATVNLYGSGSDETTVTGMEWKIGDGDWTGTETGDTEVVAPMESQAWLCSLKVTDDDGNVTFDEVCISVTEMQNGMSLVIAAQRTFRMGGAGVSGAEPVHEVTFTSNFWIDTTEVTQGMYESLMWEYLPDDYSSPGWNDEYGFGENYPAYFTDWFDAALYCNLRTKAAGSEDTVYSFDSITGTPGNNCVFVNLSIDLSRSGYRLPTEAEWEFACRAGAVTDFFWGNDKDETGEYAWYIINCDNISHEVAQKKPNSYGLYDMCGNVLEWCNDKYWSYTVEPQTDPSGPAGGFGRVTRGGSWREYPSNLQNASRNSGNPASYYYYTGFRTSRPDRPLE
jgi:formylglycine-generating enzyme required for sulfatase activity